MRLKAASFLCAVALVAVAAQAIAQVGAGRRAARVDSAPAEGHLAGAAPETVLFTAWGDEWTKADFLDWVRLYPPRGLGADPRMGGEYTLDFFTEEQLAEGIRTFVAGQQALRLAQEEGLSLPLDSARQLENQYAEMIRELWVRQNGVRDVPVPTDEEVRAYYEENIDRWMREEIFLMRNLFLSTYQEHTVRQGDTLESIAESISGDPALASEIRDPNTPDRSPRLRPQEAADGRELPPAPLAEGEILLVPMGPERAAEVEARIRALHRQLQDGADFSALAFEHSENTTRGNRIQVRREIRGRPVLEEIIASLEQLRDGEISEPIRTRHGWQIVLRDAYQPGGAQPFDQVVENVRSQLLGNRQRERFQAVLGDRLALLGAAINDEVLADAANPERAGDIVLSLNDFQYTVEAFLRDFGPQLAEEATLEEKRATLLGLPVVQMAIVDHAVQEPEFLESRDAVRLRKAMEGLYHLSRIADERMRDTPFDPTEEAIEEAVAALGPVQPPPPSINLHIITVSPSTDAAPGTPEFAAALEAKREELAARLEPVQSVTDFEIMARRISEDDFASRGGARGPLTRAAVVPEHFDEMLESAERGTIFGPVAYRSAVLAYWVGEKRIITEEQQLQRMRDTAMNRMARDHQQEIGMRVIDDMAAGAGLRLHLDGGGSAQ